MASKMPSARWISASLLVILLSLQPIADAFYLPGTFMHTYEAGETIAAKVNSLTSIETELPFSYYSLPYCKPQEGVKKSAENLGEVLMGDQIDNSPYHFHVNTNESLYLCTTDPLTKEQAELLKNRARNLYQVNMILDNLPVMRFTEQNGMTIQWTGYPVGYNPMGSSEDYIINHLKFRVLVHPYQAQGDVVVTSEDGVAMVESDRKSGAAASPAPSPRQPAAVSPLGLSKILGYEQASRLGGTHVLPRWFSTGASNGSSDQQTSKAIAGMVQSDAMKTQEGTSAKVTAFSPMEATISKARSSPLTLESLKVRRTEIMTKVTFYMIPTLLLVSKNSISTSLLIASVYHQVYMFHKEILLDYVHHDITRKWALIYFKLLLLVMAKDTMLYFDLF